jgi:DNA-binding GntR family transcriptional regulator
MRRGRLAEYAYDYTKRLLFDGTLAPGAKLRVEDVVASLHTSRQPVMDAFKRLASEGYLEITPQVGCRVVVPNAAEIADFFLILGAVQGLAADIAAERRTGEELAALTAIAARIDGLSAQAPGPAAAPAYRRLDHDFQLQIRAMAHSEAVAHLAAGLLDRRDFHLLCIPNGETLYAQRMREVEGQHRAVVEAIAAADAERARARTEALVLALGRFALATPTATPATDPTVAATATPSPA